MSALLNDWASVELGTLNEFVSKTIDPSKFPDEVFELYSVPSFPDGQPDIVKGSEIGSTKQEVRTNDVLVCKINPRINRVWRVGQRRNLRQIASSEWIVVRSEYFHAGFLRHYFSSPDFRDFLCEDVTGVGGSLTRAQPKRVSTSLVPVAPTYEQERIADKLDSLLARVDACRERLDRIPTILKRLRQSILAAACSGRLTADWRDQNSSVDVQGHLQQIAAERKRRYIATRGASAETDYETPRSPPDGPFEIPGTWVWVRAEQVCDFITKGTTPRADAMTADAGEIPFIKVYNLTKSGILDFSVNPTFISRETHVSGVMKRSCVLPGDVLMNLVGPPLGKVSLIPSTYLEWNTNQAVAVYRPVPGFSAKFLMHCLLCNPILDATIQRSKATAGQSNLTLELARDVRLPFPPFAEQTEIDRRVRSLLSHVDELERRVSKAIERLGQSVPSLLSKAFRGELVHQDANDEPAALLLKRIQDVREPVPTKTKTDRIKLKQRVPKTKAAMTKSRHDDDVRSQPYLATLIKKAKKPISAEELFKKADLPLADFYKQLDFEVKQNMIVDREGMLEFA